jgi:uncharacterized protein
MPAGAGFLGGWRGLARVWGGVLVVVLGTVVTLAILGPPERHYEPVHEGAAPVGGAVHEAAEVPHGHPAPHTPGHAPTAHPATSVATRGDRPGRDDPGPVADPDPALLEPVKGSKTDFLPRVTEDGRKAMRVYAAGFDPSSTRPKIGILVAGVGLSAADSKAAISDLPGAVSLALSPYTENPSALLAAARMAGHEYFLSLPMEPLRFPLNDAGPQALLTTLSPEQNRPRLLWALARMQGYAGVTDILGTMLGERLADVPDQMAPIMTELGQRGLMYVAAPGQASPIPSTWSKAADLIIDDPATAADIDRQLSALETIARDRGAALGVVGVPRPITIERLAAWTNGLANRGLALAPVSALMLPPEDKPK